METIQGVASHCQNTTRVSGGGNGAASTTFIALFRLGQRQVQFPSRSPLSISDGDRVIVAGRVKAGTFYADAVRNVTTGIVRHSGIGLRVFAAILLLFAGAVFTLAAVSLLGPRGGWISLVFAAGAGYVLWRALQTINALQSVEAAQP